MNDIEALRVQLRELAGRVDDLTARVRNLEHVAEVASEVGIYHLATEQNLRAKYPDGYRNALLSLWKVMPRPDDPDEEPLWRFVDGIK